MIYRYLMQALDYFLGNKEKEDSESFIDKKGLKYLFPALLGKVSHDEI